MSKPLGAALTIAAKNGRLIEVDVVPGTGLSDAPYEILVMDENYLVVLNEEIWYGLLAAGREHMTPDQLTFMITSWLVALVNEWISAESSWNDIDAFGEAPEL